METFHSKEEVDLTQWDDEPFYIPRRTLKKDKFQKERDAMGRPHTNAKRSALKPSNADVCYGDTPKSGLSKSTKQYNQTGKKYTGPNYPQKSVTGVFQDGRGTGGALK